MKKLSTKYTYLPYCIDPYSIDAKGDIDFDEDFVITKDKATKIIEVSACPGFFDGSLEMSSLEPEQPLEVNNDFYVAYNDYVMENYTEKQGGDGIVAKDAKLLLRTGQLASNMMYTGAVSYTHLDVYKRQAYTGILKHLNIIQIVTETAYLVRKQVESVYEI